eukprot:6189872-Pleurochrysis_carterae.AAC.3
MTPTTDPGTSLFVLTAHTRARTPARVAMWRRRSQPKMRQGRGVNCRNTSGYTPAQYTSSRYIPDNRTLPRPHFMWIWHKEASTPLYSHREEASTLQPAKKPYGGFCFNIPTRVWRDFTKNTDSKYLRSQM